MCNYLIKTLKPVLKTNCVVEGQQPIFSKYLTSGFKGDENTFLKIGMIFISRILYTKQYSIYYCISLILIKVLGSDRYRFKVLFIAVRLLMKNDSKFYGRL